VNGPTSWNWRTNDPDYWTRPRRTVNPARTDSWNQTASGIGWMTDNDQTDGRKDPNDRRWWLIEGPGPVEPSRQWTDPDGPVVTIVNYCEPNPDGRTQAGDPAQTRTADDWPSGWRTNCVSPAHCDPVDPVTDPIGDPTQLWRRTTQPVVIIGQTVIESYCDIGYYWTPSPGSIDGPSPDGGPRRTQTAQLLTDQTHC